MTSAGSRLEFGPIGQPGFGPGFPDRDRFERPLSSLRCGWPRRARWAATRHDRSPPRPFPRNPRIPRSPRRTPPGSVNSARERGAAVSEWPESSTSASAAPSPSRSPRASSAATPSSTWATRQRWITARSVPDLNSAFLLAQRGALLGAAAPRLVISGSQQRARRRPRGIRGPSVRVRGDRGVRAADGGKAGPARADGRSRDKSHREHRLDRPIGRTPARAGPSRGVYGPFVKFTIWRWLVVPRSRRSDCSRRRIAVRGWR